MALQVRLAVTPFLPIHQPALGVSSLLAVLDRAGIEADVAYYNLDYVAAELTPELHLFISKVPQHCLLGEMLFARALWADRAVPWRDYFRALVRRLRAERAQYVSTGDVRHGGEIVERLEQAEPRLAALYEAGPRIVGAWADNVAAAGPRVVGFTTTFQQTSSSLALARELRRRLPHDRMLLVFGGANCDGVMGQAIAESFPFVDCVVSGEGEETLLEIVEPVLHRPEARAALPRYIRSSRVAELDRLPPPNFDHFFSAWRGIEAPSPLNLVAETSRGCWFGVKSHCKFCGLNGSTLAFRRKHPDKAVLELAFLAERYGHRRFMMTDNILDLGHIQDLLPRLAEHDFELFYEIKPNLRRRQVWTLRQAGVRAVQPGIESLDTGILKLMAKGATKLQNLQTLRWCFELGIETYWSILYGFPGETQGAYDEMAALIPLLVHLPPPMQVLPFQMHRFSPYFFAASEHGLHDVRPSWSYRFAYPALTEERRRQLAYCFEFRYRDRERADRFARPVLAAVEGWDRAFRRGADLRFDDDAAGGAVLDARRDPVPKRSPLTPLERRLLLEPGGIASQRELLARFGERARPALERFAAEGWTVSEGGQVLSLVVDRQWQDHAGRRGEAQSRSGAWERAAGGT